jgi:hypothetical protein
MRITCQYWRKNSQLIKKSLDIKKILVTYSLEVIMYACLILSFVAWGSLVKTRATNLKALDYAKIITGDIAAANSNLELLKSFLVFLIVSLIILTAVFLLVSSLFQGIIWSRLFSKKFSGRYYIGFLSMTSLFFVPSGTIAVYLLIRTQNAAFFLIPIMISMHFHALAVFFLTRTMKFWTSLKASIVNGLKIHKMAIPYLLITAIVIPPRYLVLPHVGYITASIVHLIIILPLISWARYYYVLFVEKNICQKEDR